MCCVFVYPYAHLCVIQETVIQENLFLFKKQKASQDTGRVLTYNQSPSNAQEDDYSLLQRKEALGEIESANTLISDFHPLCGVFSKPSIL